MQSALKSNCDVDVQNTDCNSAGETALHFATAQNKLDVVKLLIEYKADIDFVSNVDHRRGGGRKVVSETAVFQAITEKSLVRVTLG